MIKKYRVRFRNIEHGRSKEWKANNVACYLESRINALGKGAFIHLGDGEAIEIEPRCNQCERIVTKALIDGLCEDCRLSIYRST